MSKEVVTIKEPQRLVDFADENDMLFHLRFEEAALLLKYVHSTNNAVYHALGEQDGQLFMKKGTVYKDEVSGEHIFSEAKWEKVTLDEVVDEICEMNYELRSEILGRLEEHGADFMDRQIYEFLVNDSKQLDKLFARTEFSKRLEEMAERMAKEAVQSYLELVEKKEKSIKGELGAGPEEKRLPKDIVKEEVARQQRSFLGKSR